MYVDNLQLYKSCPLGLIEDCAYTINEDLEEISRWSTHNGLFLNPTKSKCLIISKKTLKIDYFPSLFINNLPINYVSSARNLGMLFNSTLTWEQHINAAVGKVYGVLRMLWCSQYYTPVKTRLLLAKTLVIPILTFGCEVFCHCDSVSKKKLNVAFNNTARYVFGLRRYDHISRFSIQIYNISLDNLMRFRTIILLYKVIQSKQPCSLYNRIQFCSSNRSLQLIHPRYSCLTSERQFFVQAIRLWNALPRHLRGVRCEAEFRRALKIHFHT